MLDGVIPMSVEEAIARMEVHIANIRESQEKTEKNVMKLYDKFDLVESQQHDLDTRVTLNIERIANVGKEAKKASGVIATIISAIAMGFMAIASLVLKRVFE